MRISLICDWGLFNIAITPALVFAYSGRTPGSSTYGWLYIWFLKGRLGITIGREKTKVPA